MHKAIGLFVVVTLVTVFAVDNVGKAIDTAQEKAAHHHQQLGE